MGHWQKLKKKKHGSFRQAANKTPLRKLTQRNTTQHIATELAKALHNFTQHNFTKHALALTLLIKIRTNKTSHGTCFAHQSCVSATACCVTGLSSELVRCWAFAVVYPYITAMLARNLVGVCTNATVSCLYLSSLLILHIGICCL